MGAKKKRPRKNKKWIPYKELTSEEREQLRRDSDKKRFRKQLMDNKLRVAAAKSSGNHYELSHAPRPTNEVAIIVFLFITRIIYLMKAKQDERKSGMWKAQRKMRNLLMIMILYMMVCRIMY